MERQRVSLPIVVEAPDEEVLFVILSVGLAMMLSDEFRAFDECTVGSAKAFETDQRFHLQSH